MIKSNNALSIVTCALYIFHALIYIANQVPNSLVELELLIDLAKDLQCSWEMETDIEGVLCGGRGGNTVNISYSLRRVRIFQSMLHANST